MSRWQKVRCTRNTGCGEWKNLADWWCRRLFWSYYWRRYRFCGQAGTFVRKIWRAGIEREFWKSCKGNVWLFTSKCSNLLTISDYDQFGTVTSLMAKVDGWCDSGFALLSSIVSKTAVCQYTLTLWRNWLVKCNPASANDFKILQVFKPPYGMLIWKQKNEL